MLNTKLQYCRASTMFWGQMWGHRVKDSTGWCMSRHKIASAIIEPLVAADIENTLWMVCAMASKLHRQADKGWHCVACCHIQVWSSLRVDTWRSSRYEFWLILDAGNIGISVTRVGPRSASLLSILPDELPTRYQAGRSYLLAPIFICAYGRIRTWKEILLSSTYGS